MVLLGTLIALGMLVALHELGHLLVARACRMRVDQYSIGFGPVVLSAKVGETRYALSLLPLGGYVKIAGMNPHDGTAPDDPRSFSNRPPWQRFLVLCAGSTANYLIAFVVLANLNVFGMPRPVESPTIGEVVPNSAAAVAGLKPDDTFESIGEVTTANFADVVRAVQETHGHPTAVRVRRGGELLTFEITPRPHGSGFLIGAAPKTYLAKLPLGEAVSTAAHDVAMGNVNIVLGIADKLRGRGNLELGGPVEAIGGAMDAARLGLAPFFLTIALLSVGVALFNLFPIPALDGGRILFVLIEMVRRRPVNPRVETAVHAFGFLALLAVMLVVTVGDVRRRLPQKPILVPLTADAGQ